MTLYARHEPTTDEPFRLQLPARPKRTLKVENRPARQPVLFLGSHTDLAGQQDLFDPNECLRAHQENR